MPLSVKNRVRVPAARNSAEALLASFIARKRPFIVHEGDEQLDAGRLRKKTKLSYAESESVSLSKGSDSDGFSPLSNDLRSNTPLTIHDDESSSGEDSLASDTIHGKSDGIIRDITSP